MPLYDHFSPPLNRTHPWRAFHSAWANSIVRDLNRGRLPPGFYAVPSIDLDGPVEIDVATLRERLLEESADAGEVAVWSAPEPMLTAVLDFTVLDLVEVQVFFDEADPRLVAAIELASPSNKDRPSERRAFAVKCASYLHHGSSVVVIDVVTPRKANLHAEVMASLALPDEWKSSTDLYAVAYRALRTDGQHELQAWPHELTVMQPLPTLPLWLGPDLSVPLDLEASYTATCDDLRMRPVLRLHREGETG
jgi:hypothetical protein